MNVSTLPRTVLAFEYAAIRRPITFAESLILGRLETEDPRRLGVERALGQVDALAGRWFDDTDLTERGERAQAHADAVVKAQKLHAQAQQTKTAADAKLKRETKAADKQRYAAAQEHRAEVTDANKALTQQKAQAEKQAKARADAEKLTITKQAQAKAAAADQRQDTQANAADNRFKTATAAPKAELADANETAKEAAAQRADADRLAHLAETERRSRQN